MSLRGHQKKPRPKREFKALMLSLNLKRNLAIKLNRKSNEKKVKAVWQRQGDQKAS